MPLSAGIRLGPYEILAPLGAGGMGEVYKARDTRLNRLVAIKVSQERFSERFAREARAIAALNHPNICQLYDVGPDYLVMELVEGSPITTPGSQRKLLDLAVQIADGLATAHASSMVHRDLKPDNILVSPDGRVKILDFGLAKIFAIAAAGPDDSTRTMVNDRLTDPGITVGTAAYMSPEQACGNTDLLPQSDQFSLGVVLYELAADKHPFRRRSRPETLTAIIRENPEPLPAILHPPLRWLIERLLAKDPAERYDSTRDLYRELRQIRDRFSQGGSADEPSASVNLLKRRHTLKDLAIACVAIACVAIVSAIGPLLLVPSEQPDLSSYKFTPIARDGASQQYPAWSPDCKRIAYTMSVQGIGQVFIKAIDSPDAARLTHGIGHCTAPFWSPDGATVYFSAPRGLWATSPSGGTPELVLAQAGSPALHPDGRTIAFARDGKTWIGSLSGGDARQFWQPPHGTVSWARFSPDGSKLAIIDGADLWLLQYPSGKARKVGIVNANGASWFPDSRRLLIVGDPLAHALAILDTSDGNRRFIYRGTDQFINPSLSPDGKKAAYAGGGALEADVLEISLDGRLRTELGGSVSLLPDWAPSGTHYLVTIGSNSSGGFSIDDRSTSDGFSRRIAEGPPNTPGALFGRWAPDGTRFMFVQIIAGKNQLTIANASGSASTPIAEIKGITLTAHAWSPDSQWIAFVQVEGARQRLFKIRALIGSSPVALGNAAPAPQANEVIQWSPTGDWILYSGVDGMYLISPDGTAVHKLTGRRFLAYSFSRDGGQVYGISRNTNREGTEWQLDSVTIKTGEERLLAPLDLPVSTGIVVGFSLHPDGKRFLTSVAKSKGQIWMLEGFEQDKSRFYLLRTVISRAMSRVQLNAR
jgi:serine/threonine protein kinase